MKKLLLSLVVLLSACTTVPVDRKFPNVPTELVQACPDLKTVDETTKLRLSYAMLKQASRVYEKKPCIKKYLFKHIESRFLEIKADEWDIAAMLPVETFVGASTSRVWADSRKQF